VNIELSLAIGLLIGAIYFAVRWLVAPGSLPGGPVLLKWQTGVGRSSVVWAKAGKVHLSSPVMRADYAPPAPGAELVLKPIDGGRAFRARFVGLVEDSWELSL